jgi:hypothetical protein
MNKDMGEPYERHCIRILMRASKRMWGGRIIWRIWGLRAEFGKGWLFGPAFEAVQYTAEEAEDAAGIAPGKREAAQEEAQVLPICALHGSRGVAGGEHHFFNDSGEQVEIGGWRSESGGTAG